MTCFLADIEPNTAGEEGIERRCEAGPVGTSKGNVPFFPELEFGKPLDIPQRSWPTITLTKCDSLPLLLYLDPQPLS